MSSEGLEDIITDIEALKLSAFTKANKIKHYVKNVTIGPNASGEDEIRVTLTELTNNVGSNSVRNTRSSVKSRLGPKINESENENILLERNVNDSSTQVTFKNCNNFNLDMLRYENGKINRQIVRKKIQALQAKFANVDQTLQQKSEEEYNASKYCLNERLEKIETEILQDLEKHQRDVQLWQKQKIQEQEEQFQRLHQQTLALKQEQELRNQRTKKKEELDAIFKSQKTFRETYENFLKDFKSFNNATAQRVFVEHGSKLKALIGNMETLTHKCSAGSNSSEDVSNAQYLLNEMKKLCNEMFIEYRKLIQSQEDEALSRISEKEVALTTNIKNQQVVPISQPEQKEKSQQITSQVDSGSREYEYGTVQSWRKLAELQNFVQEFSLKYDELKQDTSLKTFRFNCQKAVNIPVNAIAGKSIQHAQDKLHKLDSLLSGQSIIVGEMTINAAQHPQGVAYCFDLVAKAIVKQGGLVSSMNYESTFPIAYVTVMLWHKYPDFGKLVLGYFFEKCPCLVPVYPEHTTDMSEVEFLRQLGYEISTDGEVESKDSFLKRLCSVGRLYFAIMIMGDMPDHPHSLVNAWKWIANTLNLAPRPDVSASLILQCLEVTGNTQIRHYRKQFTKIIKVLVQGYIPELSKVDNGGPVNRLKEFLLKTMETGNIDPPKQTTNVSTDVDYL